MVFLLLEIRYCKTCPYGKVKKWKKFRQREKTKARFASVVHRKAGR